MSREENQKPTPEVSTHHQPAVEFPPAAKVCTRCKQTKLFSEFSKASKGKYGLKSTCKLCDRDASQSRRHKALATATPLNQDLLAPVVLPDTFGKMRTPANTATAFSDDEPKYETILTIDMTDYPKLYQAVIDIAKQQFRTPEMQVLFWLSEQLSHRSEYMYREGGKSCNPKTDSN